MSLWTNYPKNMANEKSGNMAKGVRRMTRMYQAATKFS